MRFPSVSTRFFGTSVLLAISLLSGLAGTARCFQEPDDGSSVYEVDRRGAAKGVSHAAAPSKRDRSTEWTRYVAAHPGWVARWNESLGIVDRASGPGLRIEGFDATDPGRLERSVRAFLSTAALPSVAAPEKLEFLRAVAAGGGHWVHFIQKENGIPVFNARLTLRVSADGRVGSLTNRTYPDLNVATHPTVTRAVASRAAAGGLPSDAAAAGTPELVILPVETASGAEYRLTWRTEIRTSDPPGDWISFVDAETGELLWRFNNVRYVSVSGQVSGLVEPVTDDNNFLSTPLPYVTVRAVDGIADTVNAVTDLDGNYAILTGDADPLAVRARLAGPFGRIFNAASGNSTPTLNGTAFGDSSGFSFSFAGGNSLPSERDAYYHVMVAHDHIQTIEPGFHLLDYPMPILVDLNQTCNAFWDGFGVNFFADGGGCMNTARSATTVEHEYGHAITDFMYRPFFPSGAMHEGFSDYYAATITNQPIIGLGFRGPGTFIRRLDVPKKAPDDLRDEPHADGLIVATALWDLREALGKNTADHLWHFARYGYSDNFDDYFMDLLETDDDDGDVYNGTPHFTTAANIFRAHGIGDFSIHVSHAGTPDTEDTLKVFPITASFLSLFALENASVKAHVTIGRGGFSTSNTFDMTPTGGIREYTVQLDQQPAGTVVSYYFTASDTAGGNVTFPAGGAADPFTFHVGPDDVAPAIDHDALPDQPADTQSIRVLASITDNLDRGLGDTRLVYRLNGGSESTMELGRILNKTFYSAFLPLGGTVRGDLFEYRIEAVDSASTPNLAESPAQGYHGFHLVRGYGRNFESDDGGLLGTNDWAWGLANSNPDTMSGQWSTGLPAFAGHYSDHTTSILALPTVDLTDFQSAALTFHHALNSEPGFDGGFVEVSTDGGANWTEIVPDGDYNTFPVIGAGLPGWSGRIDRWAPAEFDLSQYLGRPDVRLRLRFVSDEAIHGPGWFIDDVQVVERQITARPLGVSASSGDDAMVRVRWELPAGINDTLNNPVVGYNVYRASAPTAQPALLTAQPVIDRDYMDMDVTNGQHYYYYASALYGAGESPLTGPAEGFPYRPAFASGAATMHVAIDSVGTVDTTLTVSNTGSGNLRVNVYRALPSQTLSDVRIHLVTGAPGAPNHPASAVMPEPAAPAATRRAAPAASAAYPVTDDVAARIERAAARVGGRLAGIPGPGTTPPAGTWTPIFIDGNEGSAVDLKLIEQQQTDDLLYFRVGAWGQWPNPNTDFNILLALDIDENQATGFRGGEYLIVAGSIVMANFGIQALLFDSSFTPVSLLNHVSLNAGGITAEFGVDKASIESPQEMNLKVASLNPSGTVVLDSAPDQITFPWLTGVSPFVTATPETPAAIGMTFSSQGLDNGDQTARLILETNDPSQPSVIVPVTLTVTGMVPVVLADFAAAPGPDGVRLTWRTSSETDHAGFHVYRRESFPEPAGEVRISKEILRPTEDGRYELLDDGAKPGHEYAYRLADISRSGTVSYHGPFTVRVPGQAVPAGLWLAPAMPNPARNRVAIQYGVPRTAAVDLRIFSVDGRLVKTLESGTPKAAGYYEAAWDGKDDSGRVVSAGVYLYRVEAGGEAASRKILWMR